MSLFKINKQNTTEDEKGFTHAATDYFSLFEKKSILSALDILEPNESFSYFTKGLNTHEVLVKLCELSGPSKVWIANYSITELPMRVLGNLKQKNAITSLKMLLDKTVYRSPKQRQFAIDISNDIAFTEIHAKIILIKGAEKNYVYISSSNLTKNHRYEVGDIIDNDSKFNFFKSRIETLINENK